MKMAITWFWLFQKRILKKPMFQITILLIPVLLVMLFIFHASTDSLIQVALCPGEDEFAKTLAEELIDDSNSVITFYIENNEEMLRKDVMLGKTECGYIFSENATQIMDNHKMGKKEALLTVIQNEASIATNIINEFILGKVYSKSTYSQLEDFLYEQHPEYFVGESEAEEVNTIKEYFEQYRAGQLMFSFEYANGKENQILDKDSTSNYYMMPVRGLLSILILVAAISGVLMLIQDEKRGTWELIHLSKRASFHYFYIVMSVIFVAMCSFVAILCTGLGTNVITELFLMFDYILLVAGYGNLLRLVLKNEYLLCALIPILVLLSLIVSPVFIDLGGSFFGISMIQKLLPTSYYLRAIYSFDEQVKMFVVAVTVSLVSYVCDRKGYFSTHRGS